MVKQGGSCSPLTKPRPAARDLSVAVALVIGTVELLQVTVGLRVLELGRIGYLVVALFLGTWAVSVAYWKARRVEERWIA